MGYRHVEDCMNGKSTGTVEAITVSDVAKPEERTLEERVRDFKEGFKRGYAPWLDSAPKSERRITEGQTDYNPFGDTYSPNYTKEDLDNLLSGGAITHENYQQGTNFLAQSEGAISSDGGSSSYYDVPIPKWLIQLILQRESEGGAYVKTEELIEAIFNNDFNFGTLFKSTVRAYGCSIGKGKAGNTMQYETNKVKYYSDKIHDRYNRMKEEPR